MQIHGLNKTTLLDYPGRVASTIFTGACNFRCPFCQNSDLVLDSSCQPTLPEEEIFSHLAKRKGIITGVCITGGEPTLQKDLSDYIKRIKDMGLCVKLDTNGYQPKVLECLLRDELLDYVAMDIKSSLKRYPEAAGIELDTNVITTSVDIIMNSGIEYEFRTTVVKELHDEEVFNDIADMINGASKYFLQGFVDSERVLKKGLSACSLDEMNKFVKILEKKVEFVNIRGLA